MTIFYKTHIRKVCNFSRFSLSKRPQYGLKLHKSFILREINTANISSRFLSIVWQYAYCSHQVYYTKGRQTILSFTILVTQHFNIIFQETIGDSDVNFKVFCKKTCIFRQLLGAIFNPGVNKLDTVKTTFIQQLSATINMWLGRFRSYNTSRCKFKISRDNHRYFYQTLHTKKKCINMRSK